MIRWSEKRTPVRMMTKRARSKSGGISLTFKAVLERLLVVISMPEDLKSERVDQGSSLTFVDWLLAIDLDPLKTGPESRCE
jgi:hypothetical protein